MVDAIPGTPVLLVLTRRTGLRHRFEDHADHTRIRLTSLSTNECVRIAKAKLGVERLGADLEHALVDAAEGNPFFLEEVVKSLVESGAIRVEASRATLSRPVHEIAIPNSIQDVIMARIDRLPDSTKKVLQLASVVGRAFTLKVLDQISEGAATREVLQTLAQAELIYERRSSSDATYLFKHALTHEVAYQSLLLNRRREVHRAIGHAIEIVHAEWLADYYEVLAHHFSRADETPKAVDYLLKAGAKAMSVSAHHEALGVYRRVLVLLPEEDRARRADALRQLAIVTSFLADPESSLAYAEEALTLFEALGDKRARVAMHLHIQVLYTWRWDGAREDKALAHLHAAAALVEDDPDSVDKGLIYQRTGHQLLHRGEPNGTLVWARRATDLYTRLHAPMGTSLGTALTYTGAIEEGIAYNERNAEAVFATRNPIAIGVWGHELLLTLALARDLERARRWGERILPEVSRDTPVFEAMIRRPLALIHTLAGDMANAEETCRAVELIEQKTWLGCIFEDAIGVAFHELRRGEWESAEHYLLSAIPVFRDRNAVAARGACSFALGLVHAARGHHAEAEEALVHSLTIVENGDNALFGLWVLPALVELHARMGQLGRAREELERGFALVKADQPRYGAGALLLKARGVLAAARGEADTAAEAFNAAIAVNRQYGLPYDEAQVWYEWGAMELGRGSADGREKMAQAAILFERAGAPRDAARAVSAPG
jgi:tetratricopeptide (TPR) repeat protein